MKINIGPIIGDHLRSLRNDHDQSRSYVDYFIFFVVPFLCGFYAYREEFKLDRESYNASITFFGIFIALLLNIQMAIFGIYQRKWKAEDFTIYDNQKDDLETRRSLLEQLNSNISYLIIVCCVTLVLVLSSYIVKATNPLPAALTVVLYAHFILTMLMVVKRAHSLFQREYQENGN